MKRKTMIASCAAAALLMAIVAFALYPGNSGPPVDASSHSDLLTRKRCASPEASSDVAKLIDELYEPANKVRCGWHVIPGGELLAFSTPMKKLIALGERARQPLQERLGDLRIQNEVVVILGAIGDESTVPLLIETYPEVDISGEPGAATPPGPGRMKIICYTHALTYLTGEPIGRSRWGTDFNSGNRKRWQEWYKKTQPMFAVCDAKPRATWVPHYPVQAPPRPAGNNFWSKVSIALDSKDVQVRRAAIVAIAKAGPSFEVLLPKNLQPLESNLAGMKKSVLNKLITAVNDKDPLVRLGAAHALGNVGPAAREAIPALLEAMKDRNCPRCKVAEDMPFNSFVNQFADGPEDGLSDLRHYAALALARIGSSAMPTLLKGLDDPDVEVRRLSAWAIGEVSPKQKGAIPALQKASNDANSRVRECAFGSLKYITESQN